MVFALRFVVHLNREQEKLQDGSNREINIGFFIKL